MHKIKAGVLLTVILCCMAAAFVLPRIGRAQRERAAEKRTAERQEATWRKLSWAPGGPMFEVRGFREIPEPQGNRPRIQLVCRWSTPPQPWNRYTFSFPGAEITYPDGLRASPMISPMPDGEFVLHYFFERYPARMASITIPIALMDTTTNTSLGVRNLTFSYWPDEDSQSGQ